MLGITVPEGASVLAVRNAGSPAWAEVCAAITAAEVIAFDFETMVRKNEKCRMASFDVHAARWQARGLTKVPFEYATVSKRFVADWPNTQIHGCALSTSPTQGFYVHESLLSALTPLLAGKTLVAHNAVYDCTCAAFYGLPWAHQSLVHDTLLMARLLPSLTGAGLKELSAARGFKQTDYTSAINAAMYKAELLQAGLGNNLVSAAQSKEGGRIIRKAIKKTGERTIMDADFAMVAHYAATDAIQTRRLFDEFVPRLKREAPSQGPFRSLWDYYTQIEQPMIAVTVDMTYRGVLLDGERVAAFAEENVAGWEGKLEAIYQAIRDDLVQMHRHPDGPDAGRRAMYAECQEPTFLELSAVDWRTYLVNIDLAKRADLHNLLFRVLGIPVLKKTPAGNPSLSKVLFPMYKGGRTIAALSALTNARQKWSNFFRPLYGLAGGLGVTRIHPSYGLSAARTGRFTGTAPNMMNLPKKGRVRSMLVAAHGCLFAAIDFAQIELRLMALLSCDPVMRHAYQAGIDIHTQTAASIYGGSPTPDQRNVGKTLNFSLLYGCGADRLAETLRKDTGKFWPLAEAAQVREAWRAAYAGVDRYAKVAKQTARARGYAETFVGRRRYFAPFERQKMDLMAVNAPIQGFAGDLLKIVMHRLYTEFTRRGMSARIVAPIHDEIILEFDMRELGRVAHLAHAAFTGFDMPLPIEYSAKYGTDLGNMVPLEELALPPTGLLPYAEEQAYVPTTLRLGEAACML